MVPKKTQIQSIVDETHNAAEGAVPGAAGTSHHSWPYHGSRESASRLVGADEIPALVPQTFVFFQLGWARQFSAARIRLASFCRETRKKSYGCDMGQVFSLT